MKFLLVFILFLTPLFATLTLKSEYFYTRSVITAYDLDPTLSKETVVLNIKKEKTHLRINAKVFQKSLKKLHITAILPPKHRYISFLKKSPINTSKLQYQLRKFYEMHYKNIKIKTIQVWPHTYLERMPQEYTLTIPKKNAKRSYGVLQVKLSNRELLLFDYTLDATLLQPQATRIIKRGESLSRINTKIRTVLFENLRSQPLNFSQLKYYSAKHTIKIGDLITQRDVALTPLIKRHDDVNVQMRVNNMIIEFSARALNNGALNDMITLEKADGKRIRAKVVGKLRAEM